MIAEEPGAYAVFVGYLAAPETFLYLRAHFPIMGNNESFDDFLAPDDQQSILTTFGLNIVPYGMTVATYV